MPFVRDQAPGPRVPPPNMLPARVAIAMNVANLMCSARIASTTEGPEWRDHDPHEHAAYITALEVLRTWLSGENDYGAAPVTNANSIIYDAG